MPGLCLRITRVEMGEEGSIGEMRQTRGIIRHSVARPLQVVIDSDEAVVALVDGLKTEEVGSRGGGSGGAFAGPEEGGQVVRGGLEGAFPDVEAVSSSISVGDATGQFQLGVVDGAGRIVSSGEEGGDGGREPEAPDDGNRVREKDAMKAGVGAQHFDLGFAWDGGRVREPDATGANAGCVVGSDEGGGG